MKQKRNSSKRVKRVSKKETTENTPSTDVRLNKYIANSGVCSRREADKLIENGEIKVNKNVVTEMGFKVKPGDTVYYKGKKLVPENNVYLLLNKPKDFITTTDDPENRRTVMDLVKNACNERIYPVGRLDRNTTGLLLFTNDGELAKKLSHPSHKVRKIYKVDLDKNITKEHFLQIQEGLNLEDGLAIVDNLAMIDGSKSQLGIEIHIGRNRIVRRIFEHLGYDVVKLDRVMYGTLDKLNLPRGKWRMLTEKEIIKLKHMN
ncbi:pseudouridine synthase [Fulvivirga sediminis]|uniref:Pseudouridine synthase n=1 Tax=Fulvivirga sediminis TaxID=2803949 RepID=A0A937F4M1_9BACT|nr:pseudouridine synthase [Fulvivirga sediminis]MBL3654614.1 rRNA pseudouridine synthase [Fulvivirga sediminis]